MKQNGNKLDTILFVFAMITVSGACFFYNIRSAEDLKMTLTLTELVSADKPVSGNVISDAAAANIEQRDAVEVSVLPQKDSQNADYLLPPIVTLDG